MLLAQACLLHQTFRWLTPHGIPGRALRRRSPNCTFGILDLFVPILSIPVRNIWGFLGSSAGQGSSMQEILVRSLGWEDPLEEGMATHSGILPWTIPMDRGACRATVHRVAKSGTQLKWLSMHTSHHFLDYESMSPVLAGRFFTTEPPGKSRVHGPYNMNRSFEIFTKSGDNDIYASKWVLRGLLQKKQEGCNPTLKFISRISLRLSSLTLKAPQCLPSISGPNWSC